ncbi:pyridoxal phosphate-dependent aminotransferase [Clostridium sp. YIM B02515]|uniref:cysteine-S-conjugate beta-lyase n=1 Tax=Clostridium rhizosphaerae TaxID=2803861 RepID=A0ABS1T8N6_9CLOT|nr:MalY/PatB family protein [Clostridium rhizosphaerae]MBL4935705.1 pyridoxal phosphate-dependent aminotransferase [Clostridium rhizosphaerae]
MKYDFDKVIDRKNTRSVKWDLKKKDIIPMWVADMDFEVPDEVVQAIKNRAEHKIYGYTAPDKEYYDSIINWFERRHGFVIKKEWINYCPGVVPAVNMLIRAFTKPGDKVILQVPVYHPFFTAVENNGCEVVENPLKLTEDKYEIDFEDLEKKIEDNKVKVLVLCNPHNPVGRVWTKEELVRLGELCIKNNVIVISDEIHCDLVYKEYNHISFASIKDDFAQISAVCTAPSKTFNLAGLQTSSIIIANNDLRKKFFDVLEDNGIWAPNIFGIEALEAAYNYGEQWLDEVIEYLKGNLDFLTQYISKNIPKLKIIKPEGTYLVWVDCRGLGMDSKELHNFFLNKAGVWFDEGYIFGRGGEGYERINIACSRKLLEEALKRIEAAVRDL